MSSNSPKSRNSRTRTNHSRPPTQPASNRSKIRSSSSRSSPQTTREKYFPVVKITVSNLSTHLAERQAQSTSFELIEDIDENQENIHPNSQTSNLTKKSKTSHHSNNSKQSKNSQSRKRQTSEVINNSLNLLQGSELKDDVYILIDSQKEEHKIERDPYESTQSNYFKRKMKKNNEEILNSFQGSSLEN